jgi:D-alanyl-D-alanine carboxypeptidase/D-alanyl-D-alanine-endopeptidase (penicillin-binding protein 4)
MIKKLKSTKQSNKRTTLFFVKIILLPLLFSSCQLIQKSSLKSNVKSISNEVANLPKSFTGLSVYDLDQNKYLIKINDDHYFTPASNTKILTLAAYLNLHLTNIPSFYYQKIENQLHLIPLGDPTFLHPEFEEQPGYTSLTSLLSDSLILHPPLHPITHYGPGWSWDDYNYYFQLERSWMPIFGNRVNVQSTLDEITISPSFFAPFVNVDADKKYRDPDYNIFNYPIESLSEDKNNYVPFKVNNELIKKLLIDTLPTNVILGLPEALGKGTLIQGPLVTPILKKMMFKSDNFLAEQLLINAQRVQGYETQKTYLTYLKSSLFASLPDPLIWVDGSGLSVYNMNTPRNLVKALEIIFHMITWDEIIELFPDKFSDENINNSFVYAKTGTLRHNQALSGYLITQSGRKLAFSFMCNHYTVPPSKIRAETEKILLHIRDAY